jgi:hypothetical protein
MSDENLKAELERLRQENAALKKGATSGLRRTAEFDPPHGIAPGWH